MHGAKVAVTVTAMNIQKHQSGSKWAQNDHTYPQI